MPTQAAKKTECPQCGEQSVVVRSESQKFEYGSGEDYCELIAEVPVGRCEACGCSFTDGTAEAARHAAVCRHLGIHAPEEIVALRKRLNLSRADLAEITRIGEASIARWERGAGFQNAALDRLLFLIEERGVLEKLRAWNRPKPNENDGKKSAVVIQFPNITNLQAAEKEASQFQLRAHVG